MERALRGGTVYGISSPCKTPDPLLSYRLVSLLLVPFPTCVVAQLFYRNGHPFPVSGTVALRVRITHTELSLEVPVTLEVMQDPMRNVVRAAFTVRRSGRYQISISVGGLSVGNSPYYKAFHPGKRRVRGSEATSCVEGVGGGV